MHIQSTQHANVKSHPTQSPTAILCRSGVGVVLVVGLAWIGFSTTGSGGTDDPSLYEAGSAGAGITGDRAAAHRREVFEARRARFEGRGQAQVAQSQDVPDR